MIVHNIKTIYFETREEEFYIENFLYKVKVHVNHSSTSIIIKNMFLHNGESALKIAKY